MPSICGRASSECHLWIVFFLNYYYTPIQATAGLGASQQRFYDSLPAWPILAPFPPCQGQPKTFQVFSDMVIPGFQWIVCVQANLRRAYAIEKDMGYMEPPRQYQPTKHCLGYVLMRAGQNQTAAEVPLTLLPTPQISTAFARLHVIPSFI